MCIRDSRRVGAGQPVVAGHVHRHQVGALGPGGDPRRAPDQRVALRPAGQCHHDPFPGLPGGVDVVVGPVPVELVLDLVGEPEQGQFPQGGEIAGTEVVAQRRVDLLGLVDVAVRHPAAQRLRGHVDQLDLLGRADHRVRDGLPLLDAGDPGDHVVERLQVLHVHRGQHADPGVEQHLDVLPALVVPGARHVGVRELVDHRDLRPPGQDGVEVRLGEGHAAVGELAARQHLQVADHRGGVLAAVRLDQGDDHVGAALGPPVRLFEHGVGLADAGRRAQIDPQLTASHRYHRPPA